MGYPRPNRSSPLSSSLPRRAYIVGLAYRGSTTRNRKKFKLSLRLYNSAAPTTEAARGVFLLYAASAFKKAGFSARPAAHSTACFCSAGSAISGIALRAVRELHAYQGIKDGLLKGPTWNKPIAATLRCKEPTR